MSRTIRSCCSLLCKQLVALLLCLLLPLQLAGCARQRATQETTVRIGVALYTQDDTFISIIAQNLQRMAQETEKEGNLKINLSIADGESNQTTQLEQIDRFISRGCDVLCVNIVDRTAAAVIVDKAEEAGIPLIFFNRQPVDEDIQRWEQVYYVGARAEEGGTLQGRLVLSAWRSRQDELDRNGDGVLQYALLEGEPGHQDSLLRTAYSIQALTEAGVQVEKLAGGSANWNRGQAVAKTRQWLEELGDSIEVLFANNDDMALGAIDAYREADAPLPLIVGVDATAPALEAVRAGDLYGTVLNDAQGIAREMFRLSLALAREGHPQDDGLLEDGHYIWLPHRPVTLDNLDEFLNTYPSMQTD